MTNKLVTLGIDLGTHSLGWCLIETAGEPGTHQSGRIIDIGVRIFSQSDMAGRDPQSKASLAVARREARGMRRRRDRYLKRRARLLDLLTENGLMPAAPEAREALLRETSDGPGGDLETSVFALRTKALDHALEPYELGRVLFHLNQRRGFKSNRKADSNDNETGKIAEAVGRLETQMMEDKARTFGEWLHHRRQAGLSVRARMSGDGKAYTFYPARAVLEREFDLIVRSQKRFHADILDEDLIAELKETIFFQRPLRPVKAGKCAYNPAETRLARSHPLFQTFRLVKEVNELEYFGDDQQHRKLTPDERDSLLLLLRTALTKQGTAPFSKMRKTLKLGPEFRFNKESDNRKGLEGDVVTFRLSRPECFGNRWQAMSSSEQAAVTEKLRTEADPEKLRNWLVFDCGLEDVKARAVMDVHLPDGFARLGPSALAALTDEMLHARDADGFVITEAAAAKAVYGRTNSETDPDRKGLEFLPKYQEVLERHIPPGAGGEAAPEDPEWDEVMGRITNPTVHIALNQLRRVVNALIKKHGRPDRIAIELGRDLKLNKEKRDEINKKIGRDTKDAIERSKELRETFHQRDNGYNRLILKLWGELNPDQPLNRVCVYCGKPIRPGMLFSGETDVDHILPYSRTLDDGQGNKILCCTACNREKRDKSPAEVPQWQASYAEILARAAVLPKNKRWRFAADAMQRFGDEDEFLARQVTDMQYVSRLALTYLATLYDAADEPGIDGVYRRHSHVRALPGRMTEMLRRNWALNGILADHNRVETVKRKNRQDHRHHAIDAAVIAVTSRSLIQALATQSGRAESHGAERLAEKVPEPWPGFRDELRECVNAIVVSHKPDHGTVSRAGYDTGHGRTAGKLHNDTAYGFTGEKDATGNDLVVRRIPISNLKKPADLDAIRTNEHGHSELRDRLFEATRGLEGKAFEAAVQAFVEGDAKFKGIRHVRVIESRSPIWITHGNGRHKKGYLPGGNYRYEVWELPDGKWEAEVVSMFDAHKEGYISPIRRHHHNARKILSLMKGDMVAYQDPKSGERIIAKVRKFDQRNKQLYLDPHNESGNLDERERNKEYKPFRPMPSSLKKVRPRSVRIDEIGQVFDPGVWWEGEDG